MLITEKAKALAQGVEVTLPPEPALAQDSNKRKAPVPKSVPVVESFLAGQMNSSPVQLIRKGYELLTEPTVGYAPDEVNLTKDEEVMGIVNQLPEEQKSKVLGALSKEDAMYVGKNLLDTEKLRQMQYANGTLVGLSSEILSWLDPISVMTGNAYLNGATKISKLARAGKALSRTKEEAALLMRVDGALAVGSLSVMEQGARDIRNEGADTNDLLYAGLLGMGAGAVLGKSLLKEGDAVDEIAAHAHDTQSTTASKMVDDMDDALVKPPAPASTSPEVSVMPEVTTKLDDAGNEIALTPLEHQELTAAHMKELNKNGSVVKVAKGKLKKLLEHSPFKTDGFRLITGKSPTGRVIASQVGELAIGGRGSAATTSAMYKVIKESQYLGVIPRYQTFKQEFLAGRGITKRNLIKYKGSGSAAFDKEVMLEMSRRYSGKTIKDVDDAVRRAADMLDETNARALTDLQSSGWEGAANIQWKSGHVPLIWHGANMQRIVASGKKAAMDTLVRQAYRSVGFSKKVSQRLAKAVINRKLAGAEGSAFDPSMFSEALQKGNLEHILREAGLHEDDIRGVLKLTSKEPNNGFMKRTNIDLTATYDGLSMTDLIHTDIENIMSRFYQESAGKYGLGMKGIKSQADIDTIIGLVRRETAEAGEDTVKQGEAVEAVFNHQLAKPIHNGVGKNTRRLLDWAMITKLGGIGFAQLAEMANVTAAHGLFTALKSVPEAVGLYRQLLKAAKTGDWSKIDRAYLGELQVYGGQMIDEHLLFRPSVHLDENLTQSGWGAVFDNISAISQDAMGHLSGMYAVKGIEQVMVLMHQADKVAKVLSRKLNKKSLSRLTDLGWEGDVANRLSVELKKHATFKKGVLDKLNLEQWSEQARTEFIQGMHRHVGQIIQRKFVGEDAYWMHSNMGAMFGQFRSYPLLAIEKQTGRHMFAGDTETGMIFLYGMGWSTVASMAKTYTNATGRSDRDEYIKKMFEPKALAMQAANYASIFSILADVSGGLGTLTGLTPGNSRGSNVVVPPSISGLVRAMRGSNAMGMSLFSDKDRTEADVRNVMSAIPINNVPVMTLLTNEAAKLFSEE